MGKISVILSILPALAWRAKAAEPTPEDIAALTDWEARISGLYARTSSDNPKCVDWLAENCASEETGCQISVSQTLQRFGHNQNLTLNTNVPESFKALMRIVRSERNELQLKSQ